jgi:hypothetical protein
MFSDEQLRDALDAMKTVFKEEPAIMFRQPSRETTGRLVDRLSRGLPPILERINEQGVGIQDPMSAGECLYAGWVYWFGRDLFGPGSVELDFLTTNRLCDHALMQQGAIDLRLKADRERAKALAASAGSQPA